VAALKLVPVGLAFELDADRNDYFICKNGVLFVHKLSDLETGDIPDTGGFHPVKNDLLPCFNHPLPFILSNRSVSLALKKLDFLLSFHVLQPLEVPLEVQLLGTHFNVGDLLVLMWL
jgi:hypothetical protein